MIQNKKQKQKPLEMRPMAKSDIECRKKKKEKEPDRSIEVTKWQIGIPNMSVFDRYNPNSLVLLLFMMTEAPSMLINRAPLTRIDST